MPKREHRFEGDIVVIPLTKGASAILDVADYHLLPSQNWYLTSHGYAACRVAGRLILMHRAILGEPSGQAVDHVNGEGLDNRRANLRLATSQQNSSNTRSHLDAGSPYKGVFWAKARKRWLATITVAGKKYHLGCHKSEIAAATAYDCAARRYQGEYAKLNFPPGADWMWRRKLNDTDVAFIRDENSRLKVEVLALRMERDRLREENERLKAEIDRWRAEVPT